MTAQNYQKAKQEKEQLLSSLGVYELRGLARAIGIRAPTTKVRERLIDEIASALATGNIKEPRESNKGRPYKPLAHLDELLKAVKGDATLELQQNTPAFEINSLAGRVLPTKSLKLGDLDMVLGGRNIILAKDELFKNKNFLSLLSALENFAGEVFLVGANLTVEDELCLQQHKYLKLFTTSYSGDQSLCYEKCTQAQDQINAAFAAGKEVVVLLCDPARIVAELDQRFSHEPNMHSVEGMVTIKKIMSTACAMKNGQTVSVVAICDERDNFDQFLLQNVVKICTNVKK